MNYDSYNKVYTIKGKTKKVKGSATSVTISGFRNYYNSYYGSEYYFQMRAYKKIGGKTYYGAWSKVKTVEVYE